MLRACWHRVVHQWETLQIELHGTYSVERLRTFRKFSERTSLARVLFYVALTPIPCLLAAILPDLIPLEAPEQGFAHSHAFWVREGISSCILTYALLNQARHFLVDLPQTLLQMTSLTLICCICVTAFAVGLAKLIGFPVPFMRVLAGPIACAVIGAGLYLMWRPYLQRTPSLRADVRRHAMVVNFQLGLVFSYPAYTCAFNLLSGFPQTVFALLLPIMKLGAKNVMNRFIQDKEDAKAEFVNFNVEVFHALFVACCLQGSTSFSTTALIIAVDFAAACVAIYDVHVLLLSIQQCVADTTKALRDQDPADPQISTAATEAFSMRYVDAAFFLVSYDERLCSHSSIRMLSYVQPRSQSTRRKSSAHHPSVHQYMDGNTAATPVAEVKNEAEGHPPVSAREKEPETRPKMPQEQIPRGNMVRVLPLLSSSMLVGASGQRHSFKLTDHDKRVLMSMSEAQRLQFVQKVLKVLHMTEFMVVVEFIELMVPMVYSTYVVVSYQLSNRAFYTPLQGKSTTQVYTAVASVVLYALLEVFSLVCVCVVLQRKLRISALHQLAFVLDTQWQGVQSKLMFWVVISLETLVQHYGVDFTFQFKWLHTNPTS